MSQTLPTLTLTIQTIHCGGCVTAIKENLLALEGVKNVEVDFRCKQVIISFDKDMMGTQTIMNLIEQNTHWCFVHAARKRLKQAKKAGKS